MSWTACFINVWGSEAIRLRVNPLWSHCQVSSLSWKATFLIGWFVCATFFWEKWLTSFKEIFSKRRKMFKVFFCFPVDWSMTKSSRISRFKGCFSTTSLILLRLTKGGVLKGTNKRACQLSRRWCNWVSLGSFLGQNKQNDYQFWWNSITEP